MPLQFDTKDYPEQRRGMLICGINWGGNAEALMSDPNRDRYHRSFFSDGSDWVMHSSKYSSRVVSWLNHLGMMLQTSPPLAGRLEKSISQVNWLPSQSVSTQGQNNCEACAGHWEFFIEHLRAVEPSLILFLSVDLLYALNAEPCREHVADTLGRPGDIRVETRDLILSGKRHPRLRVGMQSFQRATAIALPHPAYRGGIADEYIACFRDWVGLELQQYAQAQRDRAPYKPSANL